jgi:hypothetical protein
MSKESNWARDLKLYVCIALAVVGVILAGAYYAATHNGTDPDSILIPLLLFLVSLGIFGKLVQDYYAYLKTSRLWWAISCMFVGHLAVGAVLAHQELLDLHNFILLVLIIAIPEYITLRIALFILLTGQHDSNTNSRKIN